MPLIKLPRNPLTWNGELPPPPPRHPGWAEIDRESLTLFDRHGVIVSWLREKWLEDPATVVPAIANALRLLYEQGGNALRRLLNAPGQPNAKISVRHYITVVARAHRSDGTDALVWDFLYHTDRPYRAAFYQAVDAFVDSPAYDEALQAEHGPEAPRETATLDLGCLVESYIPADHWERFGLKRVARTAEALIVDAQDEF